MRVQSSYTKCLSMSLLAGLSTTFGAAVVLVVPGNRVPPAHMAFILALAGGVMLSASLLEFWIPALVSGGSRELGHILFYSCLGIAVFLVFSKLVPEPDMGGDKVSPRTDDCHDIENLEERDDLVFGGPNPRSRVDANVYGKCSSTDPPDATFQDEEPLDGCAGGVGGGGAAAAAAEELAAESIGRKWRLAMVLMLSLTAHNFPEGMAVAISALDDERQGMVVMVAIAIHNIPEGIAISVPVLSATGSRWKAVWMTLLSGIAEPLGACVALMLTNLNGAPSEQTMHDMLCAVGGVMSAVSLKELLPESWRMHRPVASVAGFFAGLIIMLVTKHFGA